MIKKIFILITVLFGAVNSDAATWFSCNGDSFCGASPSNHFGTVDLASGQSSPSGSTNVWRWTFPAGMPGGQGVADVWLPDPPAGAQEMWVQWYWKYSSGFVYHSVENKQMYFYPSNTEGMALKPANGLILLPQGTNSKVYPPNVNTSTWYLSTGAWHKIKARYVLNTGNQNNGIFQAWVDDVMVSNYSNVYYQNGTSQITAPGMIVIYGGMGGSVPQTQYLYISGIYIGSTDSGGGGKIPSPPSTIRID